MHNFFDNFLVFFISTLPTITKKIVKIIKNCKHILIFLFQIVGSRSSATNKSSSHLLSVHMQELVLILCVNPLTLQVAILDTTEHVNFSLHIITGRVCARKSGISFQDAIDANGRSFLKSRKRQLNYAMFLYQKKCLGRLLLISYKSQRHKVSPSQSGWKWYLFLTRKLQQ